MNGHDDVLRKVQALIDKADSTTFDAERDAFLAKADELMTKHAIDSYQLEQRKAANTPRERPLQASFEVCDASSPVVLQWINLCSSVVAHAKCKWVVSGAQRKSGPVSAIVVGFPADVRYAEMLFTSLRLQMIRQLEPKPSEDLSFEDNVVMLLDSGQSRIRIAELMGMEWSHGLGLKMSKIYRLHKEATVGHYGGRGTRPLPTTYMRNFASGFALEINLRLTAIRDRNKAEFETTAIVLADRAGEVSDAYNEFFPHLGAALKMRQKGKFDGAAISKGRKAGQEADIGIGRSIDSGSVPALPS